MLWVPAILPQGPGSEGWAQAPHGAGTQRPQIANKTHRAQYLSGSEDEQEWAGRILGPDDSGPEQGWGWTERELSFSEPLFQVKPSAQGPQVLSP